MRAASVRSSIRDAARNITYHILAYRPLKREEMASIVGSFLSQRRRPKLKNGQTVTIETIIGYDE